MYRPKGIVAPRSEQELGMWDDPDSTSVTIPAFIFEDNLDMIQPLLITSDGITYKPFTIIIRREKALGVPQYTYFCLGEEWGETWPGLIAQQQAEIAGLRSIIDNLRQQRDASEQKITNHVAKLVYGCPFCDMVLTSQHDFIMHLMANHVAHTEKTGHQCPWCDMWMRNEARFEQHLCDEHIAACAPQGSAT